MISGRFVAANTITFLSASMPSISFNRAVRTLTPPPLWPSREAESASISSKKMILGDAARALRKTSRTLASDCPTYILKISGPFTAMKLRPDSVASALAVRVLEQPGGP